MSLVVISSAFSAAPIGVVVSVATLEVYELNASASVADL